MYRLVKIGLLSFSEQKKQQTYWSSCVLKSLRRYQSKKGPIPQHGAVVSSATLCTKFGVDFLKKYRNSYDTAILTAMCLMGAQSDRASLGGSGSIGIYRIGQAETPADVLDFGSSGSAMGALNELKKRGDLRWNKQDYRHDLAQFY